MSLPPRGIRAIIYPIYVLLSIGLAQTAFTQVVIRERISVYPATPQSGIASTGDPVSEAFVVAPSDGTIQIFGMSADRAEGMIPQGAILSITSPSLQRSDSIWSYCSSRYYGPWLSGLFEYFNVCAGRLVQVNSFTSIEGFDRTIFFSVQAGDTVRFGYWSDALVDWCEVFQGGTGWSIHLFTSSGCYYPVDSVSLRIQFSYADSGFAQLHVQSLRDTIVSGDSLKKSTPIAVTAQSTAGREVQVDNGLLVNFSADSIALVKFVSPNGDTVTSLLNNVTYADARAGRVKALVVQSPADSLVRIGISATLASDPTKSGVDSIWISRSRSKLRFVDKNPRKLWPYLDPRDRGANRPGYDATRGFVIEVLSAGGSALSNQTINLQTTYIPLSGGHAHATSRDTNMPRTLHGKFWAQGRTGNPILGLLKTGDDGRLTVDSFRTSAFSGSFVVWACLAADTTVRDSVEIQVQVDSLVEFEAGSYWLLTGVPGGNNHGLNHPVNHWIHASIKDSLEGILEDFYEWTSTPEGGGSAIRVGVNDISIEKGGVLDIKGAWGEGFHAYHRVGLGVDIDRSGGLADSEGILTPKGEFLKQLMERIGGKKYSEVPIHFGFKGGN